MKLRDLFKGDADQRRRVDGPTLREVAACGSAVRPAQLEAEAGFFAMLPGTGDGGHPAYVPNPYLFVPQSELAAILRTATLSEDARQQIKDAILWQREGKAPMR